MSCVVLPAELGWQTATSNEPNLELSYLQATNSRRWAINLLLDAIELQGARRIIDVGAGDGQISVALAPHVDYVASVDPDLRRALALQDAMSSEINLEYIPRKVEDADLPSASVDFALLSYVLETLGPAEQDSLLESTFKFLRPAGVAIGIARRAQGSACQAGNTVWWTVPNRPVRSPLDTDGR